MSIYVCDFCYGERKNVNGCLTCIKCGIMTSYYIPVVELDLNSWKKCKSVHKRNKWFMRRIQGIVKNCWIDMLTQDFIKVVRILVEKKLIKKNVSRYNYYIIRLCSSRNIHIREKIKDMSPGKTKDRFDNNLFGTVYKELGWSKNAK